MMRCLRPSVADKPRQQEHGISVRQFGLRLVCVYKPQSGYTAAHLFDHRCLPITKSNHGNCWNPGRSGLVAVLSSLATVSSVSLFLFCSSHLALLLMRSTSAWNMGRWTSETLAVRSSSQLWRALIQGLSGFMVNVTRARRSTRMGPVRRTCF